MQLQANLLAGVAIAAAGLFTADQALAWGHTGHVMVSQTAMLSLPSEVPAFLRTAAAARQVGELGPEADVSKSSGDAATPNSDVHDFERDAGHFIDIDDSGNVLGFTNVPLSGLLVPNQGRRDFDTLLRGNGSNQYTGYLPFQMADGWQQLRKDFAYIRAFTAALANPATAAADRPFFQYQLQLRQQLTLRDLGYWSHFVADASQPMHVSIHFNGWGNFPNPNNYTKSPIHAPFEGSFVKNFVSQASVLAGVGPYVDCQTKLGLPSVCTGIEARIRKYLAETLATVDMTYLLDLRNGKDSYSVGHPDEVNFVTSRLSAGAAELRDEIVDAWRSSATIYVGFPLIKVPDIESGAVVLTPSKLASD